MTDKRWNEMSTAEKCESLKESVERLYQIANQLSWEIRKSQEGLEAKINQISAAVEQASAEKRG